MRLAESLILWISALSLVLAVACGGEHGSNVDDLGDAGPSSAGTLEVLYGPMYSGYDGVHDYKLDVIVRGFAGAKFSASKPGYVEVEQTPSGATLTMKKPGDVMIVAEKEGKAGSAKLTISEYTPAQWELGNARYNEGGATWRLETASFDGGVLVVDPETRCVDCHGDSSAPSIAHSPRQTGGYTDAELADLFLRGRRPAGSPFRDVGIPEKEWSLLHRWKMDPEERAGLVAYLRSLPLRSGPVEFPSANPFSKPIELEDVIPCPVDGPYSCAAQEDVWVCVETQSMRPLECETNEDCAAAGLAADCRTITPDVSVCIQVCNRD